jgi:hypothetical protein
VAGQGCAGRRPAWWRRRNGDAAKEEQQGPPPLLLSGNFVIQFLPQLCVFDEYISVEAASIGGDREQVEEPNGERWSSLIWPLRF